MDCDFARNGSRAGAREPLITQAARRSVVGPALARYRPRGSSFPVIYSPMTTPAIPFPARVLAKRRPGCRSRRGRRCAGAADAAGDARHPSGLTIVNAQWTGDFDGMVKRRRIRVLTPVQQDALLHRQGRPARPGPRRRRQARRPINATLKTTPATKVHVVFVPTSRDALYLGVDGGTRRRHRRNVTITPERAKLVDFTIPARTGVTQIVVTGPGAPAIATIDDLAGKQIVVREKSLQFESLTALNEPLQGRGQAAGRDQDGSDGARRRGHPRDGQRGAGQDHRRRRRRLPEFWTQVLPA